MLVERVSGVAAPGAQPHDLSGRRACDTATVNDVVLGIIFLFRVQFYSEVA